MKKIIILSFLVFIAVNTVACKSTEKVRGTVSLGSPTINQETIVTIKKEPVVNNEPAPIYEPFVPVVKEEPIYEPVVVNQQPIYEPVYSSNTLVLPEGVTVRITERGKVLVIEPKVLLKLAKPELPYDFRYVIPVIIKILDDNPDIRIVVEGHTSNKGKAYPYNYDLSVLRVDNAYNVFMTSGVAPNKIIKSPLGEALPEFDNQKDLRRFEYVIIENEADLDKYNNFVKTLDFKKESDK